VNRCFERAPEGLPLSEVSIEFLGLDFGELDPGPCNFMVGYWHYSGSGYISSCLGIRNRARDCLGDHDGISGCDDSCMSLPATVVSVDAGIDSVGTYYTMRC